MGKMLVSIVSGLTELEQIKKRDKRRNTAKSSLKNTSVRIFLAFTKSDGSYLIVKMK